MRVVMVSKALVVGAYQRKLEELAALPGVDLTAVVPAEWHDRRGRARLERSFTRGYELLEAPLRFNGHYHFHYYPTLGRLMARLRPDILHVDEEPYNFATWHAMRAGRAAGAQSLFFTWQNIERRYPFPFAYFERACYSMASHAIAGNQAAAGVLRAKGYGGPLSVIPQFGVDPVLFAPAEVEGPREGPFAIGYAGGLIPEKGLEGLLRACASLTFPWNLLIAGTGPERDRLGRLALDLGLGAAVSFLGRVPSTEVASFYRRLDVLVLPSLTRPNWMEQFGRVLVEAMACGVAVLGSDSGEIPNVIGDAGLVFREGDVGALATAVEDLYADPARRQVLAERGRQRVLGQFTQAQVAADTYDVYRSLLRAGKS